MNFKFKRIYTYFSKALAVAMVIMLIGGNAMRYPVFAQEDPTPTPEQTTIDNSSTSTTTVDTTANTGNDTATDTVTPTPTEGTGSTGDTGTSGPTGATGESGPTGASTDVLSGPTGDSGATGSSGVSGPTGSSGIMIDNSADVTNDSTSSANTGDNSVTVTNPSDTPTPASTSEDASSTRGGPTPTPSVSVMTGTAVAITNVNNDINSTSVNSQIISQTINLYIDQNASLDLSDPASFIENIVKNDPTDPVINLHITNSATVTNTVNSVANTGGNTATGTGGASISTGDAISLVSVLNRVNFVAIDSVVHVVTINIFGTLNGDIILPTPIQTSANDPCPECSTNVTNTATVNNTVSSNANTGNNTVTASTSGSLQTGDAASTVSIDNLVNTVLIGDNVFSLNITPIGTWNGSFVGDSGINVNSLGLATCCSTTAVNNAATVTNTIASSANTGGNAVTAGDGSIQTGNALSAVSLVNLVNTVLYKTTAFFGFIHIFGTWNGNIGDAASLAAYEATPTPAPEAAQISSDNSSSNSDTEDSGGALSVTNANNVGAFVYPGDTVTFFVNVKDTGSGHVYNASLYLHLLKDGNDMGGQTFPLGTINPGHGFKVTTGFVLSKSAPGGLYIARADVTGDTGPDNTGVNASADSTFAVQGAVLGALTDTDTPIVAVSGTVPAHVQVLGATTKIDDNANILLALLVLLLLVPEYILYRASKNRKLFTFILTTNIDWQQRLRAVTMLLL